MHKITGTSLIEVLVSLFLLSLLLLGWDAIQIAASQIMQNANHLQIAQQQILMMAEIIKANRYVDSRMLSEWQQQNFRLLPHVKAKIHGQYPAYKIELQWGLQPSCAYHMPLGNSGCLQYTIKL